jgi:uncharacterized protein (DUF58 family)
VSAALGELVPAELSELLRTQDLRLRRPVWGRRYGRHPSRRVGLGLDFRDHRPYSPGDDPRQLDWRAVARRDRLVLRQTEAEDDLALVVVADCGAAMGYSGTATGERRMRKWDVVRSLAAALSWAAIRQGDAVGLVLGKGGALDSGLLRPIAGHERLDAIARSLLGAEPAGRVPWRELLPSVAHRLPRRSLIVLFSDLLDTAETLDDADAVQAELLRGLAHLRAREHDVVVVQVLHRDEVEFPWDDRRTLEFVDRRGLRTPIEGTGVNLRANYLARLGAHLRGLEFACEANGLFYERVLHDAPLASTFMAMLGRLAGAVVGGEALEARR